MDFKLSMQMFICGLVCADARRQKREPDPWFDTTLNGVISQLKEAGCDNWSVDEWAEFWKPAVVLMGSRL